MGRLCAVAIILCHFFHYDYCLFHIIISFLRVCCFQLLTSSFPGICMSFPHCSRVARWQEVLTGAERPGTVLRAVFRETGEQPHLISMEVMSIVIVSVSGK